MDEYKVSVDVWEDGKRLHISTPFPFRDKDLIMALPGASYNTHEHRFLAPLTWASCVAMRGIFGERIEISPALNDWAWRERKNRVDPAMELRAAFEADGDEDLYGFQRAGVQFLAFAREAILGDDMGTGKTVQAIRTLMELTRRGENPFPAIIVAPNNMVLTWKHEFERWWPEASVLAIPGGTPIGERRKLFATPAHVHVMNYETVRMHSRLKGYGDIRLKRCVVCDPTLPDTPANSQRRCEFCPKELNRHWETIIVDEAHRLKNPRSKQTRACWSLREGSRTFKIEPARFAYGLTGTPIADAPHDLWPALHLISPDEFPTRTKYIDRYCRQTYNPYSGFGDVVGLTNDPTLQAEFFRIVDPHFRRMPKEAVLPFLPKKTYAERYVEMSPKQRKAYALMEKEMIAYLDGGITVAGNPLTQLTRLSQFASAYAEMVDSEVRMTDPSCKIDALMDLLEDLDQAPAVVFAQHRQLIDLAAKRMEANKIKYGLITGGQTAHEREGAIRDFQEGRTRVILCTISAGGIGITLTRAAVAIFLQRSWSMIDNKQAEDRVHRIGSEIHDKVEIIDIIAAGTFEERQRAVLEDKSAALEEIVRDVDTLKRILGVAA